MKKKSPAGRLLTLLLALVLVLAVRWLQGQLEAPSLPEPESQSASLVSVPPSQSPAPSAPQSLPESSGAPPSSEAGGPEQSSGDPEALPLIAEDGTYTSKEDVALYLSVYGRLPGNFITREKARSLGWSGGYLDKYAPGCCIGGDVFSNREGILPKAKGRVYRECDIGTLGKKSRGAKRIVYSNDGLIYYTNDHYESFELLYGEE